MSELEKYQPQDPDELRRMAVEYAESGMFRDALKAEQALVKIYAGAELGLGPFQSMSGVHLIQGKPVVGAGLLASLLDRDPDYDYTVEWEPNAAHPTACTITVFKNDKERGQSRFSLEDAKRAGLTGGNWTKYPSAMLFARAISQAVRWYAPGATGTSVYVEGEIQPDPPARVTASVHRFNDPIETIEGEIVDERAGLPASPSPYPAAGRGPTTSVVPEAAQTGAPVIPKGGLKDALKALSAHQLGDLYAECGILKGTRLPDVEVKLWQKWALLGLPDDQDGDPVPVTILGAIYAQRSGNGSAEAFQDFVDTGESLDAGDQAVIA